MTDRVVVPKIEQRIAQLTQEVNAHYAQAKDTKAQADEWARLYEERQAEGASENELAVIEQCHSEAVKKNSEAVAAMKDAQARIRVNQEYLEVFGEGKAGDQGAN